jgi:hypothetical protein
MEPIYYESHVTIDPTDVVGKLERIATDYKFKLAKLYMDKGGVNQSGIDMFMTGHGTLLPDLIERMESLIRDLQFNGYKVRRYKIEAVIIDSRKYSGV